MYQWNQITTIHIEASTRCNARCPMCTRNKSGGVTQPNLPLADLGLKEFQKILPERLLTNIKRIFFCGNFGDPAMAPELIEIIHYLRNVVPDIKISVNSNGGVRSPDWWSQLARCVSFVRFGVDGLEQTNHLYRQGVSWKRLQANMQAFISAGGRAFIDFLVFRHNEDQVEEALSYFKSIGIELVRIKSTARFFVPSTSTWREASPVLDLNGNLVRNLEPPQSSEWASPIPQMIHEVTKNGDSLEACLGRSEIRCQVATEKSIYVSAQGYILPCCWVGNMILDRKNSSYSGQIINMIESLPGGGNSLNALHTPIDEIVNGLFFQKVFPESWKKSSLAAGKPFVCARFCGSEVNFYKHRTRHVTLNPQKAPESICL